MIPLQHLVKLIPFTEGGSNRKSGPIFIPNREFSIFEIKEDLYFDRVHSRIYFDIQSISMYLPGDSFYNNSELKNLLPHLDLLIYTYLNQCPKRQFGIMREI